MSVFCQEGHAVREYGALWCGAGSLDAWLLCVPVCAECWEPSWCQTPENGVCGVEKQQTASPSSARRFHFVEETRCLG